MQGRGHVAGHIAAEHPRVSVRGSKAIKHTSNSWLIHCTRGRLRFDIQSHANKN